MSTKMNTAAYMEKYGWKPGMGLGKDNTGMAEHIRVSKKNDKRGIGMDGAQTFEPWWEKLYNKTAQQSMSKAGQDKQKQPGKEGQPKSVQPMKSTGQLRVLGARLAPMFVKGNTLEVDEKKQEYKVESSSISSSSSSSDSDDESRRPISTSKDTFEALGGRTGKKYSAAGKLSRLQAQEKKWALIRSNSVSPAIPQPSNSTSPAPTESPEPSKKKKKKKRRK